MQHSRDIVSGFLYLPALTEEREKDVCSAVREEQQRLLVAAEGVIVGGSINKVQ